MPGMQWCGPLAVTPLQLCKRIGTERLGSENAVTGRQRRLDDPAVARNFRACDLNGDRTTGASLPPDGASAAMSLVISGKRLDREIARRGWTCSDLARAAGLSAATVSAARTGRPISPRTVGAIARALAGAPPIEEVDSLLL